MAMARLLVVLFEDEKAMRQDIQLCLLVVEEKSTQRNKLNCFYRAETSYWWQDDGSHVDGVSGHRVEVGVDVLPIERVEDVILDCDLDIVIIMMAMQTGVMSFTVRFNRWS